MTGGDDVHVQERSSLGDAFPQRSVGCGHAGVEVLTKRLSGIQDLERFVQGVEQMPSGRFVLV